MRHEEGRYELQVKNAATKMKIEKCQKVAIEAI